MADVQEAQAPAAETAAVEVEEESKGKVAIYEKVDAFVKEKTGKRIGKTGGREIFDMVINEMFALAAREGTARFNGGFGSLHVREYQAGSRRLPSGATTTFGEREKLRYEEGVVVKALVANKGNLEEALKARGSRAPKEGDAAKPAKEAKAPKAPKPAKEAKPAAAPAAAPAPAAAAATDGDIDLA